MRILLINPNTTESMTEKVVTAVTPFVADNVEIIGATSEYGPPSIEGYYDEVFSIPPMLEIIKREQHRIDGIVIACFDDTGVDAARTMVDVPVIGICQAAMQTASVLAGSFSVITTLSRSVPALEHLAQRYGYGNICRAVRASEIPVLELEKPGSSAEDKISSEIELALKQDKTDAIVLGCAGMVELASRLSDKYQIPVIEGAAPAVKIIEGLAKLGLKTSNCGGYANPAPKSYSGIFDGFSPEEN